MVKVMKQRVILLMRRIEKKISQVALEFKNALHNGERVITLQLVGDLEREGFTCVYKDNSVWKQKPRIILGRRKS